MGMGGLGVPLKRWKNEGAARKKPPLLNLCEDYESVPQPLSYPGFSRTCERNGLDCITVR
jgi:hypothetical protein